MDSHLLGVTAALASTLLVLLSSGCASGWKKAELDGNLHATLQAAGSYGPVDGYLQTPSGGNPGTTTHQRPTFKELNIDDALSAQASMELRLHHMGLYGAAHLVRLDNSAHLDKELLSQGTLFPAGSPVDAAVQLDTYRFGYQHTLAWVAPQGSTLTLTPSAGLALFNFDYALDAPAGLSAHRSYLVASPQLGVGLQWAPPGRFSVAADIASSIPEVGNLLLLNSDLTARYRLWGSADRGGSVFLGAAFERIDYEDKQTVPNHIKADLGPLLLFGIRVAF